MAESILKHFKLAMSQSSAFLQKSTGGKRIFEIYHTKLFNFSRTLNEIKANLVSMIINRRPQDSSRVVKKTGPARGLGIRYPEPF